MSCGRQAAFSPPCCSPGTQTGRTGRTALGIRVCAGTWQRALAGHPLAAALGRTLLQEPGWASKVKAGFLGMPGRRSGLARLSPAEQGTGQLLVTRLQPQEEWGGLLSSPKHC